MVPARPAIVETKVPMAMMHGGGQRDLNLQTDAQVFAKPRNADTLGLVKGTCCLKEFDGYCKLLASGLGTICSMMSIALQTLTRTSQGTMCASTQE